MSDGSSPDALEARLARLEDLEDIRALDARYCRVLDAGDWDTLVSLFTSDGEFVGLGHARGHGALRRFFASLADDGLTAFWHHVSNLEITLAAERDEHGHAPDAEATSLLWQPCVHHGEPHIAAGRYHDTLTRDPARGWLYRRKRVSFDYFCPLHEGWGPARFTLSAAAVTHRPTTIATERP